MNATHVDHVHDDSTALADAVAQAFLDLLVRVQAEGRDPHVVLTGGSMAGLVHARIAELAPDTGVDWGRVHFWWGDERFVPADDTERNAVQAQAALLGRLGVTPRFVHRAPASDTAPDAATAARQYAEELEAQAPRTFDLVMLSLGPDGHIASLFPGHDALDADESEWTVAVTDSPKPPPQRVSLSLAALARTSELWLMATGAEKAEAVVRSRTPGPVSEAPLRALLHGGAQVKWYMDRAATSPKETAAP
ncbi:6-phosphogluconolactonase [Nocardioides gilvus]|uniref:6-phosphogluconolactonase n=1 Tax=Nocardioides gilvus TaxID=1735589 RepID=UPI000D7467AE|nr:6-phosphogluconolactonase [Nocardioides gilvus]